jgi:hypothetical protein
MDITSDYNLLTTTINWSSRGQELIKRLRLDIIDKKQFMDLL